MGQCWAGFTPHRMLSCCWVSSQRAWHSLGHGDIHGVDPQLDTGDREEAAAMGMCQEHHLPSSFSPIWALGIKQGLRGQVQVMEMYQGHHLPHMGSQG